MNLLFFLLPAVSICSNILFLNTWHSKSHGRTMAYLAEKLVGRGHNVTMYSMVAVPIGSMGKGVHALESQLPKGVIIGSPEHVSNIFWYWEMTPLVFNEPNEIGYQYLEALKDHENLLQVLETPFDLILLDEMFAASQTAIALKLKQKFGSKMGCFSTTDQFAYSANYRALSRNPATFPSAYTTGYAVYNTLPERFYTRFTNILEAILEHFMFKFAVERHFVNAGILLDIDSSLSKLYENSKLTFTDYPTRYGGAVPRSIDYISVSEHCPPSNELSEKLKNFVEDPTSKGTIYVAFGSIVNWQAGPPHVIHTFVNVFNRLSDYRVIWSYTGPELNNARPNILTLKWAPQNDILAHHKTVLFFTHGGLKSLREGICSNTPLLFLPFFADQNKNAAYAVQMNLAEAIYKGRIEEDELYSKMTKALKSESMKKSVANFANHFTDNPINSLDHGVFWVEKLLKYGDIPFAHIHGRDLSWCNYFHIEAIIFLSLLVYIMS